MPRYLENPVTVRKWVQLEFWAKYTKLINIKKISTEIINLCLVLVLHLVLGAGYEIIKALWSDPVFSDS